MYRKLNVRLLGAIALSALIHLSLLLWIKPQAASVEVGGGPALNATLLTISPVVSTPATPAVDGVRVEHDQKSANPTAQPQETSSDSAPEPSPPVPQRAPPPLEVPLIVDPIFYPPRELDVFPKSLAAVNPPFPRRAVDAQVSGTVTLELLIDETGLVHEATVLTATPEGYFEEAALESFRLARFTPAQKDGKVVRSKLAIQVDFTLDPEANQFLTRAVR